MSKDTIVEEIKKMNLLEIVQLVKLIEKEFEIDIHSDITTKSTVSQISNEESFDNNVEQKEFNLYLENFGENKISVIKEVRVITGLGLKEAKQVVESAPVKIKEHLTQDQANSFKDLLEKVGAKVTIN
mgnify:CR=1 FL=1